MISVTQVAYFWANGGMFPNERNPGGEGEKQMPRYSEDQLERFADALRQWRGRMGFNQQEAANEIGISRGTLQGWERVLSSPQAENLAKVEEICGPRVVETLHDGNAGLAERLDRVLQEVAELRRQLGQD